MNDYSKDLLESFLDQLSLVAWVSLDNDKGEVGSKADYRCEHKSLGLSILELKELGNPKGFDKKFSISRLIEKEFKGIFGNLSFSCQFTHPKDIPTAESIFVYKRFLKAIDKKVKTPCRIAFPTDGEYSPLKVVEINRLDSEGKVLKTEYFPPTKSGIFPRGRGKFENFRILKNKCRIITDKGSQIVNENEIFSYSDRALLEMKNNDLDWGAILGPPGGGHFNEARRIRRGLGEARRQLGKYVKLNVPLGVIFTSSGIRLAEFRDLEDAVYGDSGVSFPINASGDIKGETKLIHGKNRVFQPNFNTRFSYVGWVSEEESGTTAKVIHNEFASIKLPFAFFDGPMTEQYTLKYKVENSYVAGFPTRIQSNKDLDGIRNDNQPIIEELKKRYPRK